MSSRFISYCKEIEEARKAGFWRVVLPSAIILPDICGRVEYRSDKVSKRYERWVVDYLRGITPVEHVNTIHNSVGIEQCTGRVVGMRRLAKSLYKLRNSVLHECNVKSNVQYLFDTSQSETTFPVQIQSFSSGHLMYRKVVVDVGVLINRLCSSAMRYYVNSDEDKKVRLDSFDNSMFDSSDVVAACRLVTGHVTKKNV